MGKLTIIRKEGGSRVIAITQYLPSDWQAVEIEPVKKDDKEVTLKIVKVV